MNTYAVTYWTGDTQTVAAESVRGAYLALGYADDDGESHLWEETDNPGVAMVTGTAHGDYLATIQIQHG